jgi:hypothetical protein
MMSCFCHFNKALVFIAITCNEIVNLCLYLGDLKFELRRENDQAEIFVVYWFAAENVTAQWLRRALSLPVHNSQSSWQYLLQIVQTVNGSPSRLLFDGYWDKAAGVWRWPLTYILGLILFCWPCILIFFVMKTNQMHYVSFIYFVSQPLHVSGVFIVHHQEVFTVYVQKLVRVIGLSSILTRPAASQLTRITRANCCTYTVNTCWWWAINTPETVEVEWRNKLRINSASGWFSLQRKSYAEVKKE